MLSITKQNGLLYLDLEYIESQLNTSQPCEVCNGKLIDHQWIELNENGMCERCSLVNYVPSPDVIESGMMASYNAYGGTEISCNQKALEDMLTKYQQHGTLALGCWELRRDPWNNAFIDARLAPAMRFDSKDNCWASWEYTFQPVT
jgi:hypothetical protein